MKSHFSINGGVAVACAVAGASTMLNGNCSAQTFSAADYATNSTYAGGWQPGNNGGYGFGPWSMDGTSTSPIQNAIDSTSPYDPFGVAWAIYNPAGKTNISDTCNTNNGTDISRVGRACPALQVGQTFSTVVANPTQESFYRGYTIRLVSGGDNTTYGNAGTRLAVGTFEYFTYGRWYAAGNSSVGTALFDKDTATNGMELDVTLTDTNSYHLVMTPVGNPGKAYTQDGTLNGSGPVDWIEYEFYNTDSDFYPTVCPEPLRTDFYIKDMTITALPPVPHTMIAADYATNYTYSAGWVSGFNGGYGFGPWSFDGTSGSTNQQEMTYGSSDPFDALGTAWTLLNYNNSDLANAGRGFAPLQIGETIEAVVENPTDTAFYRGYTISLNTGTNNEPGGFKANELVAAYTFDYFNNGQWYVGDGSGNTTTSLFNTDTAAAGMKLDITLTDTNSYQLTMTPLANPTNAYTQAGTFKTNAPAEWIQFQFYNTASNANVATEFYISSLTISGLTLDSQLVGTNIVLTWPASAVGFTLESALSLGAPTLWYTNSTPPVVVGGLNVVTNPITGTAQFYRLKH
jgi:hypothetical protein